MLCQARMSWKSGSASHRKQFIVVRVKNVDLSSNGAQSVHEMFEATHTKA